MKTKMIITILLFLFTLNCEPKKKVKHVIRNNKLLSTSEKYIPEWIGNTKSFWQNNDSYFFKIFMPEQTDITNGLTNTIRIYPAEVKKYIVEIINNQTNTTNLLKSKLKNLVNETITKIPNNEIISNAAFEKKYWEYWNIFDKKNNSIKRNYTIYILVSIKNEHIKNLLKKYLIKKTLKEETIKLMDNLIQMIF